MDNHTTCAGCGGGSCGGCGSFRGALELTQPEIDLLRRFAQLPFLPVARRADQETPVCLEEAAASPEALSAAIWGLAQKGLIRLDYDLPLLNFDYAAYEAYSHKGSMALTARGQAAVELLEIQGIGE